MNGFAKTQVISIWALDVFWIGFFGGNILSLGLHAQLLTLRVKFGGDYVYFFLDNYYCRLCKCRKHPWHLKCITRCRDIFIYQMLRM